MKSEKLHSLTALLFAFISIVSCQKSAYLENETGNKNNPEPAIQGLTGREALATQTASSTGPYSITLESRTETGGNWEWIWSVENTNPGNGSGGTVQNLSHWGMEFGFCLTLNNIVQAAYSADGITWTSFTPSYQIDPSQPCYTSPVFKFDYGTTGSSKSYYKVVVNQQYAVGTVTGYYKSGRNTGCGLVTFQGMSCNGVSEPK